MIPAAVKAAVQHLHINTGHRNPLRLARALLVCGAPKEAILAAKNLKCSVCLERRPPKPRLPASLPPPREVGQQVHVDLLLVEDSLKRPHVVAHATDNVSRFQAAQVLPNKSSAAVIGFLQNHWIPLRGVPHTIVADQGREFVSAEFCDWCDSKTIYVYHIGVGAPWQNGIAERSGGTLKALVGAISQSQAVSTLNEIQDAVSEAVTAYNSDVNAEGVTPLQTVTGRNPSVPGDVLNNFGERLAEHSLISASPSLAKQVAMRETARLAMVRLHYSRGLREAELGRSRSTTHVETPQPGDLVFFWRAQKYNSKKGTSRRRLLLNRWHGPGLLVAKEGADGTSPSSNCFISFRGQLTKCPTEHVRKSSSLESIAAGSWEAAIEEVIEAAKQDQRQGGPAPVVQQDLNVPREPEASSSSEEELIPAIPGGLTPAEVVAAFQPAIPGDVSAAPSLPSTSRVATKESVGQPGTMTAGPSGASPGSPVPMVVRKASQLETPVMSRTLTRARSLDNQLGRGQKRLAEAQLTPGISDETPAPNVSVTAPTGISSLESQPAFEALTMTWEQLCNLNGSKFSHPLLQLQAVSEMDRRSPVDSLEYDHGSWDGRWAFLCERDWEVMKQMGNMLPIGGTSEVLAVQSARKEYVWNQLSPEKKKLWEEAAVKGWRAYIDNNALEVLDMAKSAAVRRDLVRRGELDRILQPRFVLTDKHDGLRTHSHPLPIFASSRLVVPGFKDQANLEGALRRDAPTGSRLSQHFLFCVAAFHTSWSLISADVKSAFLKGDPYVDRELYLMQTNTRNTPSIPLLPGQLARVLKGVFGLADAPREWWLRLSRSMAENQWVRSLVDAAMWCLWSKDAEGNSLLEGIVVAHVDDLLFTGSVNAEKSLLAVGDALGFGSLDRGDFCWCGKRIRRASDGTIRISMVEYHANLSEVVLQKHRKSDPTSALDAYETKQLRAVLGSLQWLVAQVRFDMAFHVSTLQGESPPNVGTILKANSVVREFKRTGSYELIFRPVDYRSAGIVMVSDAALGNVRRDGSTSGTVVDRTYSQAGYVALLGDDNLLLGKCGAFNVLDSRSHRIPRVCRSTYGAETLSAEESMDVGQLCRGFVATLLGRNMLGSQESERSIAGVRMTCVVDAKDVHDKCNSDTPSYGSQKSLAFTISWMRSILRQPNTSLKWTATDNMFVDSLTKEMDLTHFRRILEAGFWSISYSPQFVKQVSKARSVKPSVNLAGADFPGEKLEGDDPLLSHLIHLGEKRGWHTFSGIGVQVAYNAKSFRTPEPRFSATEFPLRSSFGRFQVAETQNVWHRLESAVQFSDLPNQHALIGCQVPILVTMYHSSGMPSIPLKATKDKD